MTKNIVFDSYALLVLFRQEEGHEKISHLLTDIAMGEKNGFMCTVNVGEVYYITARKQDEKKALIALDSLRQFPIEFIEADLPLSLASAKLKARYKMSYADAFAAALTISKKGTLITGDKEFKHLIGETHFKVEFI